MNEETNIYKAIAKAQWAKGEDGEDVARELALMPKFLIRVRETRVHEFEIEAVDREAAAALVDDLECGESVRDSFDSQELLDIDEM